MLLSSTINTCISLSFPVDAWGAAGAGAGAGAGTGGAGAASWSVEVPGSGRASSLVLGAWGDEVSASEGMIETPGSFKADLIALTSLRGPYLFAG